MLARLGQGLADIHYCGTSNYHTPQSRLRFSINFVWPRSHTTYYLAKLMCVAAVGMVTNFNLGFNFECWLDGSIIVLLYLVLLRSDEGFSLTHNHNTVSYPSTFI